MIRFALNRKIAIGVVSTLAAATLAIGGTTVAQADTLPSVESTAPAPSPTVSPASAVPLSSINDCKASYSGDLCWWVSPNQVGKMHPVRDAISSWTTQKESTCPSGTWNDCASTLYNASADGAVVWRDADYLYGDPTYCVPAGAYLGDLGQYGYQHTGDAMDNTISANSWQTTGC